MKMNAWFVVAAWATFLVSATFFVLGITGAYKNEILLINTFLIFVIFALGHLVLGIYLKCPNCGKRPTVQGFRAIHPSSKKKAGLDGWAVVVINIIGKGQFRCIHCGSDFHV